MKKIEKESRDYIKEKRKTATQLMGGIPKERLAAYKPPFYHTSVYYFGPMEINFGRN